MVTAGRFIHKRRTTAGAGAPPVPPPHHPPAAPPPPKVPTPVAVDPTEPITAPDWQRRLGHGIVRALCVLAAGALGWLCYVCWTSGGTRAMPADFMAWVVSFALFSSAIMFVGAACSRWEDMSDWVRWAAEAVGGFGR